MLEKLYADVLRNVRKDGFLGETTADVAEVHGKMKTGLSPNGLVAWSIAQYLRDRPRRTYRGPIFAAPGRSVARDQAVAVGYSFIGCAHSPRQNHVPGLI